MIQTQYQSIFKNASYLIGAQLVARFIRVIYMIILARYLGAELYGIFQYTQNWYVSFTPLTLMGMGVLLSREVGKNKENGASIVGTTFLVRLLLAFVIGFLTMVVGYWLEPEAEIRTLIIVFSLLIVGRAMANWVREVFTAYECAQFHLIQITLSNSFLVCFGLTVMFMGGGLIALASVFIITLALEVLASFLFINKAIVRIKPNITAEKLKYLIKQGLPIGVFQSLNRWMFFGPVIICRYILDLNADLGQIAVTMLLLFFIALMVDALLNAALPVLSRVFEEQTKRESRFINRMLCYGTPLCVFIALCGMTFGEQAIVFLYGAEYHKAGLLLGPALWLLLPYTWLHALSQLLIIREHVVILCLYMLFGVAGMMGLMAPFISMFGMHGVLYAMATGIGLTLLGLLIETIKLNCFVKDNLLKTLLTVFMSIGVYYTALLFFAPFVALLLSNIFVAPYIVKMLYKTYHLVRVR